MDLHSNSFTAVAFIHYVLRYELIHTFLQ